MYRVQESVDSLATRQYMSLSGRTGDGSLEHHATWTIHWSLPEGGGDLRLRKIEVEQFERSTSRNPHATLLHENHCIYRRKCSSRQYADQQKHKTQNKTEPSLSWHHLPPFFE